MGQHKHNPIAIAAKEGKLPPKRTESPAVRNPKATRLLAQTLSLMAALNYGGGRYK